MDWGKALDPKQALANLQVEATGDWYRDPWSWPELAFVAEKAPDIAFARCNGTNSSAVTNIDVPKENFGTRPAMVLDPVDRLAYQMLVDSVSDRLIGDLSPNAFGWRLPPIDFVRGHYARNDHQVE